MIRAALLSCGLLLAACSTPSSPRDCVFAKVIRVDPAWTLPAPLERDLLALDRNVQAQCR